MKHQTYRFILLINVAVFLATTMLLFFSKTTNAIVADCSDVYTPLSSYVVNGVNANKSYYINAMNATGVPWEMLAAIHYRETNFSHTNPSNGQGIFQFVNGAGGPYPAGPVSDAEFVRQLTFMANRIQDDYALRNTPNPANVQTRRLTSGEQNISLIKNTLYSYNGRSTAYAQQGYNLGYFDPYDGSPYVMNRFDCNRARLGLVTKDYGPIDGVDTRYGAFTVFARLRGDDYWWMISGATSGFVPARLTSFEDNGDPRQWLIFNNKRVVIPDPETVIALNLENFPLVNKPGTYIGSFPDNNKQLGRLIRPEGSLDVYFADKGNKYRFNSANMISNWGLSVDNIIDVPYMVGSNLSYQGDVPRLVRSDSSAQVMFMDGGVLKHITNPYLLDVFGGNGFGIATLSSVYVSRISQGNAISSPKVSYSGKNYIADGNNLLELNSLSTQTYPAWQAEPISQSTFQNYSVKTAPLFIRPINAQEVYLIDNGQKNHLTSGAIYSTWSNLLGSSNSGNSYVSTAGLANMIGNGQSISDYIVSSGGNYYFYDTTKYIIPANLYSAAGIGRRQVYNASSSFVGIVQEQKTLTRFLKSSNSPSVYLQTNSGVLRHITSPEKYNLWAGAQTVTQLSADNISKYTTGNTIGVFVGDSTKEYVMSGGAKSEVTGAVKTSWKLSSPESILDGTLNDFPDSNPLSNELQNNNQFYIVNDGVGYGTVDRNIANIWSIDNAPSNNLNLIKEFLSTQPLTRFVLSKNANDSRMFIVDRGALYHLTPEHASNLGTNGPYMYVNPELITKKPITLWNGILVKDENNSYYVIDGGGKRTFTNSVISDHWRIATDTNLITTVSVGFLNSLQSKGTIERAIKGSSMAIYSTESTRKSWIRSTQSYNNLFATHTVVSDSLINAMPNGVDIQ